MMRTPDIMARTAADRETASCSTLGVIPRRFGFKSYPKCSFLEVAIRAKRLEIARRVQNTAWNQAVREAAPLSMRVSSNMGVYNSAMYRDRISDDE